MGDLSGGVRLSALFWRKLSKRLSRLGYTRDYVDALPFLSLLISTTRQYVVALIIAEKRLFDEEDVVKKLTFTLVPIHMALVNFLLMDEKDARKIVLETLRETIETIEKGGNDAEEECGGEGL